MSKILNYIGEKINSTIWKVGEFLEPLQNKDIFIVLTIILVAFASFGLGRLSKIEETREPITIEEISNNLQSTNGLSKIQNNTSIEKGRYVASKNGTKYFLVWCSGANTIKEANKVWFATKEEAESAGFQPASNCPGI